MAPGISECAWPGWNVIGTVSLRVAETLAVKNRRCVVRPTKRHKGKHDGKGVDEQRSSLFLVKQHRVPFVLFVWRPVRTPEGVMQLLDTVLLFTFATFCYQRCLYLSPKLLGAMATQPFNREEGQLCSLFEVAECWRVWKYVPAKSWMARCWNVLKVNCIRDECGWTEAFIIFPSLGAFHGLDWPKYLRMRWNQHMSHAWSGLMNWWICSSACCLLALLWLCLIAATSPCQTVAFPFSGVWRYCKLFLCNTLHPCTRLKICSDLADFKMLMATFEDLVCVYLKTSLGSYVNLSNLHPQRLCIMPSRSQQHFDERTGMSWSFYRDSCTQWWFKGIKFTNLQECS